MQLNTKFTLAALASLALLGACSRNDEASTTGQQGSSTSTSRMDRDSQNGGATTSGQQSSDSATTSRMDQAKNATTSALDTVGAKAKDAGITASIKTDLARDTQLSALSINVDTVDGRVTLSGTAPDASARERATTLANAVSGVVGVDNKLVTPGG